MGFCTSDEQHGFLAKAPVFEQLLIGDGFILIKYWFSVSDAEQERRFQGPANDALRWWKLSEVDLEASSVGPATHEQRTPCPPL